MRDKVTMLVQSIAYELSLVCHTPHFTISSLSWLTYLDKEAQGMYNFRSNQKRMVTILKEYGIDPLKFVEVSKNLGVPMTWDEQSSCFYTCSDDLKTEQVLRILRHLSKQSLQEEQQRTEHLA